MTRYNQLLTNTSMYAGEAIVSYRNHFCVDSFSDIMQKGKRTKNRALHQGLNIVGSIFLIFGLLAVWSEEIEYHRYVRIICVCIYNVCVCIYNICVCMYNICICMYNICVCMYIYIYNMYALCCVWQSDIIYVCVLCCLVYCISYY